MHRKLGFQSGGAHLLPKTRLLTDTNSDQAQTNTSGVLDVEAGCTCPLLQQVRIRRPHSNQKKFDVAETKLARDSASPLLYQQQLANQYATQAQG